MGIKYEDYRRSCVFRRQIGGGKSARYVCSDDQLHPQKCPRSAGHNCPVWRTMEALKPKASAKGDVKPLNQADAKYRINGFADNSGLWMTQSFGSFFYEYTPDDSKVTGPHEDPAVGGYDISYEVAKALCADWGLTLLDPPMTEVDRLIKTVDDALSDYLENCDIKSSALSLLRCWERLQDYCHKQIAGCE